jgi:hypothetical protein
MKKLQSSLLYLVVAIIFVGATTLIAHAQGFTNESFQGTYTGTTIDAASDVGTFGIVIADGNGNWSGSGKMNSPAPLGQRKVIDFTFTGTYNVNEDGTFTAEVAYTLPNGATVDAEIDFIVRQAEVIDGVKIMTEGYGLERGGAIPSLKPGALTIFVGKRLPD